MDRRDFLSLVGTSGYALVADLRDAAAAPAPADRERISQAFDAVAPPGPARRRPGPEPNMRVVDLACDVFIAGGGLAGVSAALAAARHGARVVIAQDRSRLGGNSSSEVKMHVVGADCHGGRPGWREGGIIEELRLEDALGNPHRSWELWDLLLYDKLKREPNVVLLLDSVVYAAETRANAITRAHVRCDKTEHLYRVKAKVYLDCTGDSRLGLESGAELRWGREARAEFNESLGLEKEDRQTLGSSILFTARDYKRPVPFTPPPWARKVTKEALRFRQITSWEYGYWWIAWGGTLDTIRDNERIRFELLSIVLGIWDYIKNSGAHPSSATWGMDWVGFIPGKRENRRLVGDHFLTQNDLMGVNGDFDDAVAIGGWPMDDHPPAGFDAAHLKPNVAIRTSEVYSIPLRALYSRNVSNLMMAGRNISASHVAFTSTRVMATCSVIGQAAGTAAALCAHAGLTPRQLAKDKGRVRALQEALLRDDQTIKNRRNGDALDLARQATASASAETEEGRATNVTNGLVRNTPGRDDNLWVAPVAGSAGAWIELAWPAPQTIGHVQLTFDTGFQRELILTSSDSQTKKTVRAAMPECARDYELSYTDASGEPHTLARVTGNHQRLVRHTFAAVKAKALRLTVTATNGGPTARVFEVRAYENAPRIA